MVRPTASFTTYTCGQDEIPRPVAEFPTLKPGAVPPDSSDGWPGAAVVSRGTGPTVAESPTATRVETPGNRHERRTRCDT